jgi:hypothetical protein
MIKREIPNWCKKHKEYRAGLREGCCCCGEKFVFFQCGDGIDLHSLCRACAIREGKVK